MKFFLVLFFSAPLLLFGQQHDSALKDIDLQIKEAAQPVYIEAFTLVAGLRNEVASAKKHLIKPAQVVADYNKTLGKNLGIKRTLSQVDQRLTEAGDAYIDIVFKKEQARLYLIEAAKAKLKSN